MVEPFPGAGSVAEESVIRGGLIFAGGVRTSLGAPPAALRAGRVDLLTSAGYRG